MTRLPAILSTRDLPLAELCAARIDGELHAVGGGWAVFDEPDRAELRAVATAMRAPRELVVTGLSAAWVLGAVDVEPPVAVLCRPIGERTTQVTGPGLEVRELQLEPEEIVEIGGVRCTGPDRTALEVLRDPRLDDVVAIATVASLETRSPGLAARLGRRLSASAHYPHKALAVRRLARVAEPAGAAGAQPSLTR